ncbi:MAG TPA: urease accessory protein UreD [Chthoniobacterales bacterium]|jgi:urease accessory protein
MSRGIDGHLDLVCALDGRGKSVISHQSFRAPMHLSKPWLEGETLIVHLVNQTAGLLSGDCIATDISVETGARLLVTTPSASRAHRTPHGEIVLRQQFTVADGAWLEVFPELFIPQGGTTCRQHTRIDLETGASLLYIDMLAPGRVASGESFQYDELDWRTDVFVGGSLLVRERSRLCPQQANIQALRRVFPNAYYGTVYLVTPQPLARSLEELLELQSELLWIGLSALSSGGWAIKLLASDSVTLRQTIQVVRQKIYAALGTTETPLRKI